MRLADDAVSLAQVNRLISRLRRIGLKAAAGNVVDLMEATRGAKPFGPVDYGCNTAEWTKSPPVRLFH
jgi:hypothetical protein